MERNQSVEVRVRKWLSENGYDYDVRTYQPGEDPGGFSERGRETITIPALVEDAEAFMKQFVESFEKAHGITVLKKRVGGIQDQHTQKSK